MRKQVLRTLDATPSDPELERPARLLEQIEEALLGLSPRSQLLLLNTLLVNALEAAGGARRAIGQGGCGECGQNRYREY